MFRTLDFPADGAPVERLGPDAVAPPAPGTLRWVDLCDSGEASLAVLRERFQFHPLALEDCAHLDQRPKLEEYGEYLFIVNQGFTCPVEQRPTDARLQELHAFLAGPYLVTVHTEQIGALDGVWKRAIGDGAVGRRGADFLYYLVVDAMVDANFPILDQIADEIEQLERRVLIDPQPSDLGTIFELKDLLLRLRRVLSPQRDMFAMLAKRGDSRISERTSFYFRDVYDHLVRMYEAIDADRDLLGNALDAYLSMSANKTNEIMKRLTLLSAVFLPLTFITGFFGQNFEHMPFGNDLFLYTMLACCLLIPASMVLWFKRSGWF